MGWSGKISVSTQIFLFREFDEDVAKVILDSGFSVCELWAMGRHIEPSDENQVMRVGEICEKYGITPETAHLPLYLPDGSKVSVQRDIEYIKRCVNNLKKIGTKTFVVHIKTEEDLKKLIELCGENQDVVFAVENSPDGDPSLHKVKEFVEGAGVENLGICVDVGHLNIFEKPPEKTVFLSSPFLCATHLSDNDGQADLHFPPGQGTINWEELLKSFLSIKSKFQFNLTLELAPLGQDIPEIKIREVLERSRELLESFLKS